MKIKNLTISLVIILLSYVNVSGAWLSTTFFLKSDIRTSDFVFVADSTTSNIAEADIDSVETRKTTMEKLNSIKDGVEWYMKYFPVPYASYSSETNFLFGLSKYNAFTFDHGDKLDSITQPSSINSFAYYTFNKQWKIAVESNLMFNKNKSNLTLSLYVTDYPLQYYGVGNNTMLVDERTLVSSNWQVSAAYFIKTWRNWYVGPSFDFYDFYKVELAEGETTLPEDSVNLTNNLGNQGGLGLKIQMEGRDNRLNAQNGFYVEAGYHLFRKEFGSDFKYNYFHGDVRYYFTPIRKLTVATRLKTESKQGDVPVQSLSFLGGDYSMRGTYYGRYRDKNSLVTELEFRFPVYWIFGGVVFNSIGQVAPSYREMAFKNFHYTYGAGLRVKVDSKNDVNLRFDYGLSSDQHFFIINFAEVF